jgi:hypothetical protein
MVPSLVRAETNGGRQGTKPTHQRRKRTCHRMWQRTKSGRRVRVTPLTRRRRARTWIVRTARPDGEDSGHQDPGPRRVSRTRRTPVPWTVSAGPQAEQGQRSAGGSRNRTTVINARGLFRKALATDVTAALDWRGRCSNGFNPAEAIMRPSTIIAIRHC